MSHIQYKYALVDEMSVVMKQKLLEKEPRACWCDNPLPLETIKAWLLKEVQELFEAPPGLAIREAADVANLAGIYADVVRRAAERASS